MSNYLKALLCAIFFMAIGAWAQGTLPLSPPTGEEIAALVKSMLSLKGAGTLVIATVVIQLFMLVARFSLQGKNHKHLIPALMFFSLGTAVVEGLIAGRSVTAILMSAAFLTGLQNFGFQIYNQYVKKPSAA